MQSRLAVATSRFRHQFTTRTKFPIDFTDPISRECALQFFDQDREEENFFHTNGVLRNSRFSSADDKDLYAPLPFIYVILPLCLCGRILELLAKLFCTQEWYTRSNDANLVRKRTSGTKSSLTFGEEILEPEESYLSYLSERDEHDEDYVLSGEEDNDIGVGESPEFAGLATLKVQAPKFVTPTVSKLSAPK